MSYKLFCGDCSDVMSCSDYLSFIGDRPVVIVTDPPFNIGYHYRTYKDRMDDQDYISFLCNVLGEDDFVLIHYPEKICEIAMHMNRSPERVVSWIYNSNTARQHRDIAFFGVRPDFGLVRQPYKNQNDKRIQKRIREGKTGAKLYDWWNVNQVKNVSKEKTVHPCQMPQTVMDNIIGIIPNKQEIVVVDPFMGSGTTGIACGKYDVDFVGIDIDEQYFNISKERIENCLETQISLWEER